MKPNYIIIPLITIVLAGLGSFLTSLGLGEWYQGLVKPDWTPPGYFISTAWTVIYVATTISALLIYNTTPRDRLWKTSMWLFAANGLLNVGWSAIFFGLHLIPVAFFEMIVLEITVLALMIVTWPLNKKASLLLLPYLLWVGVATYLTITILSLN